MQFREKKNFDKIQFLNWQFYLPEATGQFDMWSPAVETQNKVTTTHNISHIIHDNKFIKLLLMPWLLRHHAINSQDIDIKQ